MGLHFGYKISLFLLPLGCVLQIVSVASPYWIDVRKTVDNVDLDVHLGLWKVCVSFKADSQKISSCTSVENTPDWFKGTRGVAILGILIGGFGVMCLLIKAMTRSNSKILGLLVLIPAILAALFILIGIAIFATKLTDLLLQPTGKSRLEIGTDHLSWAWYVGVASAVTFAKSIIWLCFGVSSNQGSYSTI